MIHLFNCRSNTIKDENNVKQKQYAEFVRLEYEPRFDMYEKEVEQYNRSNYMYTTDKGVRIYFKEPYTIKIPNEDLPNSYIARKQYQCSQANFSLDQASGDLENKLTQNIQAARTQMLDSIAKKRTEWKSVVDSVQTNATKVVRSDGVFDPIVIPPGKHRTILMPGISGVKQWPNALKLMLYDLPSETDGAGNVTKRINMTFELQKEDIDVFSSAE
jgi:hypothetical protein